MVVKGIGIFQYGPSMNALGLADMNIGPIWWVRVAKLGTVLATSPATMSSFIGMTTTGNTPSASPDRSKRF